MHEEAVIKVSISTSLMPPEVILHERYTAKFSRYFQTTNKYNIQPISVK